MEKASGGRFALVTRKADEDEGRGRLGHCAKHVRNPGLNPLDQSLSVAGLGSPNRLGNLPLGMRNNAAISSRLNPATQRNRARPCQIVAGSAF
jgi:hypothetical protein